ncbi:MAG: hypothetical protein OXH96_10580 [Spirochaetaceae bacterium]|nr:hypothetical protein [Spirochaetaceae bacterium]
MSISAQKSGRSEELAREVTVAEEPIGEVVVSPADDADATHKFVDRKVWQGLVKSDEDVEYLYRVGRRFLFWQNLSNLLQVIGATTVAAMILAHGPMPYTAAMSAVVGAVALLAILFRFSEKHAAAVAMEGSCRSMSRDWRKLWEALGEVDDRTALARAHELEEKTDVVTAEQVQKLGNVKERLQRKAVRYTHLRIRQEFGG